MRTYQMTEIEIKSEEISVTFHSPQKFGFEENDYGYSVTLVADKLKAEANIYNISLLSDPSPFFKKISKLSEGWKGKKTWESLEEDLIINATFDENTQKINLQITLINSDYYQSSWNASVSFKVDLQKCSQLANDLHSFLRLEF